MHTRPIAIASALILAACNTAAERTAKFQQDQVAQVNTQIEAAVNECGNRVLNDASPTVVAFVQCWNKGVTAAFQRINFPDMDLIELVNATRAVDAERLDSGQMTLPEFNLDLAEVTTRVVGEVERRHLARVNAQNQAIAAEATKSNFWRNLLIGAGRDALRPQPRSLSRLSLSIATQRALG